MIRPATVEVYGSDVTIATTTISYPWATSVSVTRKGALRIYQGWRQRAYHPRGEWKSYTVEASGGIWDTSRKGTAILPVRVQETE